MLNPIITSRPIYRLTCIYPKTRTDDERTADRIDPTNNSDANRDPVEPGDAFRHAPDEDVVEVKKGELDEVESTGEEGRPGCRPLSKLYDFFCFLPERYD